MAWKTNYGDVFRNFKNCIKDEENEGSEQATGFSKVKFVGDLKNFSENWG